MEVQTAPETENVKEETKSTQVNMEAAQQKADQLAQKMNPLAEKLEGRDIEVAGRKFTLLQVILFAASAINIIACFLPFATVSFLGLSSSVSWIEGDGIIAIICVVVACILTFINKKVFALIPAVINLLVIVYDCISGAGVSADIGDYGSVGLGIGAYLALLAAIVVLAMAVLGFVSERNKNK